MKKIILSLAVIVAFMCACEKTTPAPDTQAEGVTFSGTMLDGKTWKSEDHKGKPILLTAMATFCGYCRMSVPQLIDIHETIGGKDVNVVAVYADEDVNVMKKYVADNKIPYTVIYNGGQLMQEIGVQGFPLFILLDANHVPVKAWEGYSQNHSFKQDIAKLK
ncbi:Thiol-disulfide isomerase or thioredoxin [Parelusimicrobium proximum]|uniref:TlpA family protein disulfide reductase n=1 Tax=Parelusimicrobium proximum TaxID=3228953 RepID=UPI003D1836E4